jgi:hypothetical protein
MPFIRTLIRPFIPVVLVSFLCISCVSSPEPSSHAVSPEAKSLGLSCVNIVAWDRYWWHEEEFLDQSLDLVKYMGAKCVALDYSVQFDDLGHRHSGRNICCPLSADIENLIRKAKAAGFQVILKPHVSMTDNANNRNTWNTDVKVFSPASFFPDWKAYLLELAALATRENVDCICIGTELNHIDWVYREQWLDLIAAVRGVFPGELTYDAIFNVDKSVKMMGDVCFWDALDFMSVSFYVPLRCKDDASVEAIRKEISYDSQRAVADPVGYVVKLSKKYKKQVMFLEGGYPSIGGGLRNPNREPAVEIKSDNDLQMRGWDAYLGVIAERSGSWLKGVSAWCVSPGEMPAWKMRERWVTKSLVLQGKPAVEVIKKYFELYP